jgi:hypothetical protein
MEEIAWARLHAEEREREDSSPVERNIGLAAATVEV